MKFNSKYMAEFKNKGKQTPVTSNPNPTMEQPKPSSPKNSPAQLDDLASKRTKTRYNRSNYTRSERAEQRKNQNNPPPQPPQQQQNFRKNDEPERDLFGQFKKQQRKDDNAYFYADNYQEDIKQSNYNYSNVLNRELGKKGGNQQNLPKLIPSVNYTNYRDRPGVKEEAPVDKYNLLMENLSQSQRQRGLEEQREESVYSKFSHNSKVLHLEYWLKGDRFVLQNVLDRDIKKDFVNTGFHVTESEQERQPVTNKGSLISKWSC